MTGWGTPSIKDSTYNFYTGFYFRFGTDSEDEPKTIQVIFIFMSDDTPKATFEFGRTETTKHSFVLGRQNWGTPGRNVLGSNMPAVAGVQVVRRVTDTGAYMSDLMEQPADSYFEITKIEPHATNPDLVWMTGKFSCTLLYRDRKTKINIRNAEFRAAVNRPQSVLDQVWLKK
jgi:hypothetical protein